MEHNDLVWTEEGKKTVGTYRIFSVTERYCRPPLGAGALKTFSVIETHDWAMILPLLETPRGREFVMVRQWRHGERALSVEFPGGVMESGELTETGAARELREETGYIAGKVTKLGMVNPNPAIMSNHMHFYLAEDLTATGRQDLDEDEFVAYETFPVDYVVRNMGKPPFIHALTATALMFYCQAEMARMDRKS
jgi:8-oxo-dGTP pyrophosphatase MutT (NUDIX family)